MRTRAAALAVTVLVLAAGCSGDDDGNDGAAPPSTTTTTSPVVTEPGYESSFTEGPCPAVVPDDERVTCGVLVVPEDRRDPEGRVVRLAVARLAPPSGRSAEPPLLWLTGGPGAPSLRNAQWHLDVPLVEDRELVLVDLRGTGESEPSLACPEAQDEVDARLLPSIDAAGRQELLDALAVCRDRLTGQGIDLRAFDYTAMAADLSDLRAALDVDQWDVYGISNGGRLALEYLRRRPEGIRSLVLDAALAPQGNYYTELWPHADRAFSALFAACAADSGCAGAYPDLEAEYWSAVERLGREPVVETGVHEATGRTIEVVFDDAAVLRLLHVGLYDHGLIPLLPQLIHEVAAGRGFDVLAGYVLSEGNTSENESLGERLSANCREEIAFIEPGTFEEQAEQLAPYAPGIAQTDDSALCEVWDVGRADPSVDEPVESDVPALLVVGAFDPIHPLPSSEAIAEHLPNSAVFEMPGLGHGVAKAHPCPTSIVRAFLADPTAEPDGSCVADMPEPMWALPEPLDG